MWMWPIIMMIFYTSEGWRHDKPCRAQFLETYISIFVEGLLKKRNNNWWDCISCLKTKIMYNVVSWEKDNCTKILIIAPSTKSHNLSYNITHGVVIKISQHVCMIQIIICCATNYNYKIVILWKIGNKIMKMHCDKFFTAKQKVLISSSNFLYHPNAKS